MLINIKGDFSEEEGRRIIKEVEKNINIDAERIYSSLDYFLEYECVPDALKNIRGISPERNEEYTEKIMEELYNDEHLLSSIDLKVYTATQKIVKEDGGNE